VMVEAQDAHQAQKAAERLVTVMDRAVKIA
jgi:hypothetical protein